MKILLFCCLSACFIGCVEKGVIDIPADEPILTVDAFLTNVDCDYQVALKKSTYRESSESISTEPVNDAIVTISDNYGNIDTLSILTNIDGIKKGYYKNETLRGIAERTYTLKIVWQEREYYALTKMMSTPVIKSSNYVVVKRSSGNNQVYEEVFLPSLNFDSKYDFYFLFREGISFFELESPFPNKIWRDFLNKGGYGGGYITWRGYSILNGSEYPQTVSNFVLDNFNGVSYELVKNNINYLPTQTIEMYRIPKEAFEFYRSLNYQFNNDGGIFSSSPFNTPTNISNGAIGFFIASEASISFCKR